MKNLIVILGLFASGTGWAMDTVTEVDCATFEHPREAIRLHRVEGTFEVTYFNGEPGCKWHCTSDEGHLPDGIISSISCEEEPRADSVPSKLEISSGDGVLNMGELTVLNRVTHLFCTAKFGN